MQMSMYLCFIASFSCVGAVKKGYKRENFFEDRSRKLFKLGKGL